MARLIFLFLFTVSSSLAQSPIEPNLIKQFAKSQTVPVLVHFEQPNYSSLASSVSARLQNRINQRNNVQSLIQEHSSRTQAPLRSFLQSRGIPHKSFAVGNIVHIASATKQLVQSLASFQNVTIRAVPSVKLAVYSPSGSAVVASAAASGSDDVVQWGVARVQADKVWALGFRGAGVVVATMDTGVRGTHEALRDNYRGGNNSWYDPLTNFTTPTDDSGHGTHTMGILCGQKKNIGIAPDAKWIACRACNETLCDVPSLLECAKWILQQLPHIVSNSWTSGSSGNDWFNGVINAWTAAGIKHVFAIGNAGPGCMSAQSPGDQSIAFGVGSTNIDNNLSNYSSKGSPFSTSYKPDGVAPGQDIYSSWPTDDSSYALLSGTSMSTPNTAGIMALVLQVSAEMNQTQVVAVLKQTASTKNLTVVSPNYRCNPVTNLLSPNRFPNPNFGYGLFDALSAVQAVKS